VAARSGPRSPITMASALRAHARAVGEVRLEQAQAIAWRLLAAGVIDVSVLTLMAEHLFGVGQTSSAERFARIAAATEPARHRAYLLVLRACEATSRTSGHFFGGWAFACDPSDPEAPGRAGSMARLNGDGRAALIHFQRSLALRPWSAVTWTSVAVQLRDLGDDDGSLDALRRAACLSPGMAATLFATAASKAEVFNHLATVEGYERVLLVDPGHHVAHQNRGHALRRHGRLVQAVAAYRRSMVLEPAGPDVLAALGQLSLADRDIPAVHRYFSRAGIAGPENAEAQFFGALTDLRLGRFEAGWERYFWFLKLGFPRLARRQRLPRWPDQEPNPTGVLVWNDQFGIGEEVMYLGAMDRLADRVDQLVICCSPKLGALVRRSFPQLRVTSPDVVASADPDLGARPSEVPLIAAISSLRRGFDDFPRHQGYLVADPDRVARLRDRYRDPSGRPLVGISWSSPLGFQGPRKSAPLAEWGPVFQALDGRYVSLQYHADADEIAEARARHGVDILVDPDLDTFEDLDAHAAQIAAMDRIVSISSIAAHLAGALGKPVDMIYPNEIAMLWYWFHDREDSPWYPSMTIHRPPEGGNLAALMSALARRLGEKTSIGATPV
jgi:tetratricopeptide (TPR) repeat protein